MATMTFVEASGKQKAFITTLLNERVVEKEFEADLLLSMAAGELTKGDATDAITAMLKAKRKPSAAPTAPKVTETGYYYSEAAQTVFEVVKAKSTGNLYAKKMVPAGEGEKKGRWEYAPGAITHSGSWTKLSLSEAIALGKTWGYCCVCGRTLTATKSVEAGIGPICAGKLW